MTKQEDAAGRNCPMCGKSAHKSAEEEWVCSTSRRREFADLRACITKITSRKPKK